MILNTLHRIVSRALTIAVLLFMAIFVLVSGLQGLGGGQAFLNPALWMILTWILGVGLIGRDLSEGVLPLLLTRPVPRHAYVLGRYLGLLLALGILLLLCDISFFLVVEGNAARSGSSGILDAGSFWPDFFASQAKVLWTVALTGSLLCFLSTLLPGLGDLAVYLLAILGSGALRLFNFGPFNGQWPLAASVALFPSPMLCTIGALGEGPSAYLLLSGIALVELGLALLIIRGRDISYVSGA